MGLELEQQKVPISKPSCSAKRQFKKAVNNNSNTKFTDGRRNDDLFKVAYAMKGRDESYENIKLELLSLNQNCEPSLARAEMLEIVDNVWNRY